MVNIKLIEDDGERVVLKLSFWSLMKIHLIGWSITTSVIVLITLIANQFI